MNNFLNNYFSVNDNLFNDLDRNLHLNDSFNFHYSIHRYFNDLSHLFNRYLFDHFHYFLNILYLLFYRHFDNLRHPVYINNFFHFDNLLYRFLNLYKFLNYFFNVYWLLNFNRSFNLYYFLNNLRFWSFRRYMNLYRNLNESWFMFCSQLYVRIDFLNFHHLRLRNLYNSHHFFLNYDFNRYFDGH